MEVWVFVVLLCLFALDPLRWMRRLKLRLPDRITEESHRALIRTYAREQGGILRPLPVAPWNTEAILSYRGFPLRLLERANEAMGEAAVEVLLYFRGANPRGVTLEVEATRWLGMILGRRRRVVRDRVFERAFAVRTHDEEVARAFLDDKVRTLLTQARRALPRGLYLRIKRHYMAFGVRSKLASVEEIDTLCGMSLVLFDRALAVVSPDFAVPGRLAGAIEPEGVHLLPASADRPALAAVCQICGETIEADPAVCASCHTPHHRDCWDYNGGCSVYGCGSSRLADG